MGTPSTTWDSSFEATPAGTDDPRAADDRMREIKSAVRERLEREHGGATSEASARHGVHREGSARASYAAGDPTTAPDGTSTRALNSTDDDGRLHVDATTKKLRAYDGSSWFGPRGIVDDAGVNLNLKRINIGDWNMDTSATVSVAHGLTLSKIVHVTSMIRNDADTQHWEVDNQASVGAGGSAVPLLYISAIDGTNITLSRYTGSSFDHVDFNSTSYNRGWILIWYTD